MDELFPKLGSWATTDGQTGEVVDITEDGDLALLRKKDGKTFLADIRKLVAVYFRPSVRRIPPKEMFTSV